MSGRRYAIFKFASWHPEMYPAPHHDPDRVLIDCPSCRRSHFVTVDECPGADEAAAETAMVDGRKAA